VPQVHQGRLERLVFPVYLELLVHKVLPACKVPRVYQDLPEQLVHKALQAYQALPAPLVYQEPPVLQVCKEQLAPLEIQG